MLVSVFSAYILSLSYEFKMRKRVINIGRKIQQAAFFVPFSWYFFAFVLMGWLVWNWLNKTEVVPDTAFGDIFSLLLKVALVFTVVAIGLALISVLLSWLMFIMHKRKNDVSFKVETGSAESSLQNKQPVKIHLKPVLKPFLGFVKLRLQYDTHHYSDKFSLVEQGKRKFFSNVIDGVYYWKLPEIKEYHVSRGIIYFEDFFQFFSIAVNVKAENRFITQPDLRHLKDMTAFPRKTEETTQRIEELKKVEGEYVNYKHFETNDDVRRIVWKIYAKNKELVVRIPEIMDPYASHIYLYASFFDSFDLRENKVVAIPFLNYYKSVLWTVYQQLTKQGLEVRYVADQSTPAQHFNSAQQEVKYIISTSKWQTGKALSGYFRSNETAVLVVSSLNDVDEIRNIADQYGNDVIILFVKLSHSLEKHNIGDWVQWLFVQQEKDEIENYKRLWNLSLNRSKLLENEKKIDQLLRKFEKPVIL